MKDPALVTPDSPLRVTIPSHSRPGEHVLPVAFDGEFYLPLGRAEAAGRETRVILERLPKPTEAETRTLGGSLRILFQKIVARTFGVEYRYPILAAADVGEDFRVRYEPDLPSVQSALQGRIGSRCSCTGSSATLARWPPASGGPAWPTATTWS